MDYPADGTSFELDDETVGLLYKAVNSAFLTAAEKKEATRAIDYISAATLVVEPEDDDEPAITVEGVRYSVLSNGDAICPECGAARSPARIADHMASEHWDDDDDGEEDEYDDNDMENPYPRDREDGEGLGLTRPSYGE